MAPGRQEACFVTAAGAVAMMELGGAPASGAPPISCSLPVKCQSINFWYLVGTSEISAAKERYTLSGHMFDGRPVYLTGDWKLLEAGASFFVARTDSMYEHQQLCQTVQIRELVNEIAAHLPCTALPLSALWQEFKPSGGIHMSERRLVMRAAHSQAMELRHRLNTPPEWMGGEFKVFRINQMAAIASRAIYNGQVAFT